MILLLWLPGGLSAQAGKKTTPKLAERLQWLRLMDKIARPVLENLAGNQLRSNMPMELSEHVDNRDNRAQVGYLEAFGRTLSGIAPWLQVEGGSSEEQQMRERYRKWAMLAVANAVNPEAKDYLKWDGGQPLVDASFFALGLVRCPWLWEHLDEKVKGQVADALKKSRNTIPVYSNWILFSGMIETFFLKYGLDYQQMPIEFSVREFTQHWYVGDGMYSDGMSFHLDYYNSIVIQPFLSTILEETNLKKNTYNQQAERQRTIGQRYAVILERMISSDGSYPVLGRSIAYRSGVFHHLAFEAFKKQLPAELKPAQVRGALEAMINKTLAAPNTFNDKGYLNLGLYGRQPGLADFYITTGSLYLCLNAFLPLGLPDTDEFWTSPDEPWTAVKIWRGEDVPADHALDFRKER